MRMVLTQSEIAESCATVKEYCRSNTEDVNNNIVEFKEVILITIVNMRKNDNFAFLKIGGPSGKRGA